MEDEDNVDGDVDDDDDFGNAVDAHSFGFGNDDRAATIGRLCESWNLTSVRKRWIYIWLTTAVLCALASIIAVISILPHTTTTELNGGYVATLIFNLLLLACVVPLANCIMCREGLVIIP